MSQLKGWSTASDARNGCRSKIPDWTKNWVYLGNCIKTTCYLVSLHNYFASEHDTTGIQFIGSRRQAGVKWTRRVDENRRYQQLNFCCSFTVFNLWRLRYKWTDFPPMSLVLCWKLRAQRCFKRSFFCSYVAVENLSSFSAFLCIKRTSCWCTSRLVLLFQVILVRRNVWSADVNVSDRQGAVKQCNKKISALQETIAFGCRIDSTSIDRNTAQSSQ